MSINYPLDEPLYEGSFPISTDVPWRFPVDINGHGYNIDWTKYRRTTLQVRRLSSDDSVEPGESTLSAAGVWPRAQDNWFLGAGQLFLDNRFAFESVYVHSGESPSVRTRYWKSLGVNPWEEGQLTLFPAYTEYASGATGMQICLCGTYIYYSKGKSLYWSNAGGAPSEVTSANSTNITGLASDGSRVWFATGADGVYVTDAGSTSSTTAGTPAALNNPQGIIAVQGTGTVDATNLPNGSTHWWISAVDAFGNQTAATEVTDTVASNPEQITWNPDPTVTSWNVYRLGYGLSSVLVTNVDTPAFTDDGSIAGTSKTAPSSNGTGSTPYAASWIGYSNKGYLLASTGPDLVEILADQTISFITTSASPDFVWTCLTDCPSAILVGGNSGHLATIGAIQPDSNTIGATLAPPTSATTLPPGETINAIGYSAGSILMGTSEGIRSGTQPDSTGTFDVNPVITDPGNCLCITPWQTYEYFGWSNYDPTDFWVARDTASGIGRADLSQYTTEGVPAYATDVMSTTTGNTTGIILLDGVPWFVVDDGTTSTLWQNTNDPVDTGWMEPGWLRFGTLENKILVELDFQHFPLPAGASVEFAIVDQQYAITDIGTSATEGATTVDEPLSTGLQVGDQYMPLITLNSSGEPGSAPVLISWITKAMVTTKRNDEILVPIILRDEVSTIQPNDQMEHFYTYNEFLFLKGLEATGQVVSYTEGTDQHDAYVDQIMVEPYDMNEDRTWYNALVTVKLITLS